MKRTIIITSLSLSGLLILDSFNAWQSLVLFFIAGQIPGTDIILSGATMLSLFALLIGIVAGRLTTAALRALPTERFKPSTQRQA